MPKTKPSNPCCLWNLGGSDQAFIRRSLFRHGVTPRGLLLGLVILIACGYPQQAGLSKGASCAGLVSQLVDVIILEPCCVGASPSCGSTVSWGDVSLDKRQYFIKRTRLQLNEYLRRSCTKTITRCDVNGNSVEEVIRETDVCVWALEKGGHYGIECANLELIKQVSCGLESWSCEAQPGQDPCCFWALLTPTKIILHFNALACLWLREQLSLGCFAFACDD